MTTESSQRHRYVVIGPVLAARGFCDTVLAGESAVIADDVQEAARLLGPSGVTAAIVLGLHNSRDERSTLEVALHGPAFADIPVALVGPMPTLGSRVDAIRLGAAGVLPEGPRLNELDAVLGRGPADDLVDLATDRSPAAALERTLQLLRSCGFTGTLGATLAEDLGVISFVKGCIIGTRFRGLFDDDALVALLHAAPHAPVQFEVIEAHSCASEPCGTAEDVSVLLIEDDDDTRRVYTRHLERAGLRVTAAATPEEGLALAVRARPDVVVTDLHMPRIDGWRVLAELRSDPATMDARLVLFSALHEILGDLERTGVVADAFVKKDGHARTLIDVVVQMGRPRAAVRHKLKNGEPVTTSTADISLGAMLAELADRPGWHLVLIDDDWTRAEVHVENGRFSGANASTPGGALDGIAALNYALSLRPARVQLVALPWTSGGAGESILPLLDGVRTAQRRDIERRDEECLAADASLVFARERLRVYRHRVTLDLRPALAALSRGESPRSLVSSGAFDPMLIDRLVIDLVRRGVARPVDAVRDPGGALVHALSVH